MAEITAMWEDGWKRLFDALEPLTDADLTKTVESGTEPHSVMQAINRQVAHYSYHVGQIVYLSRYFAGDKWQTVPCQRSRRSSIGGSVASGELADG